MTAATFTSNNASVALANGHRECIGGRTGTAWATRDELEALLGPPHWAADPITEDTKVTHIWFFDTPRGPAELRDYWWNRENEHSIASSRSEAALWLARYLRRLGVEAWKRGPAAWEHYIEFGYFPNYSRIFQRSSPQVKS